MSESRFAAKNVTTAGRKFPARITQVEEQTKTWTNSETGNDEDVTQLALRFDRADGRYELEWYRLPEGNNPITLRSDIGKLINYFQKMKIPDIGENDYQPIRDIYVWVEVFPRTNRRSGEQNDKRFPVGMLSQAEIAEHFGAGQAAKAIAATNVDSDALFTEILPTVKPVIDGLRVEALFTKLAGIAAVNGHPQANTIFELAHKGELSKWLEAQPDITVEEGSFKVAAAGGNNATAADVQAADVPAEAPAAEPATATSADGSN